MFCLLRSCRWSCSLERTVEWLRKSASEVGGGGERRACIRLYKDFARDRESDVIKDFGID